jgi:ribosomal protein S21
MNTLSQRYADLNEKFQSSGIFQDMRKHRHFETQDRKIQAQKTSFTKAG